MNQEYLKSLFTYDRETGDFRWKVARGRNVKVGQLAGGFNGHGYFVVKIDGKSHLVHRLIWLYETGEMPVNCIDHINRIRDDNRFCNLRDVSYSDNCQNIGVPKHNTSGHIGVSWYKRDECWNVYIKVDKKNKWLGRYKLIDDAIKARKNGEAAYYNLPKQEVASWTP
jgi:hypothetical protein